jgi:glycosyltransferase involved in cell wall biosynthesis
MHVLFMVENASVPLDRRVWKESLAVKEMGHDVSIVCPRGQTTDKEKQIVLDGITIYRYPNRVLGSGILSYAAEYLNALFWCGWLAFTINLRKKIDVFHAGNPPDIFFLIVQWYRLFGAKYVFDIHDLFVNMFQSKFHGRTSPVYTLLVGVLRWVERMNIACADYVILTNNSYREYIQQTYKVSESRSAVVRNAPPLDKRGEVAPDPSLKRGRKYLMVYFGVMGEDDGVDIILKALHYLKNDLHFDDFTCALIGPTEVEMSSAIVELQKLHKDLALESHVEFTGFLPWSTVHQYLNTADVGLSPDPLTDQNNLSTMIKMMEYMSHGLPIVSFNLKENRYSGGDAAIYCDTFDLREFAEKTKQLLINEELRREMGRKGIERYRTQFNWTVSRETLQAVYRGLGRT